MYILINIYHVYNIFFIKSSNSDHLGYIHVLAIMNNDIMNMRVQVSLWNTDLIPFGYVRRSGIAGLCNSSGFSCPRTFIQKLFF